MEIERKRYRYLYIYRWREKGREGGREKETEKKPKQKPSIQLKRRNERVDTMDFHVSFIMLMDLRLFLNCFSPHSTHSTFTIYLYASKCTYVPVWLPIMPRVHMHTQPNAIVNHLFPFISYALALFFPLLHPTHTHKQTIHIFFFPLSLVWLC